MPTRLKEKNVGDKLEAEIIVRNIFIIFLIACTSNIYAGWYRCYTYKGKLAGLDIHMYLQIREINATSKDSIPVSGVYKYDKYNEPIVLKGFLIKNKSLELIEYQNKNRIAELNFPWNKDALQGMWLSDKKKYPINLEQIGFLSDLDQDKTSKPTEILMSSSLSCDYLVGVYYKENSDNRARLSDLKIINKKNNKIKQIVSFNKKDRPVGNVSTIIFNSARVWKNIEKGEESIEIDEDDGQMGQTFFLTYNKELDKFIKDK